jgi:hypothetical protein
VHVLQAPYMIPQLRRLLEEGVYQPAPAPVPLGSIDFPQAERRSTARIIMTAAQRIPAFDGLTTVIQVRPCCCCVAACRRHRQQLKPSK